jgi:cytochrome c
MTLLRAVLLAALALAASVLLARVHPFGDAGLYSSPRDTVDLLSNSTVPPQVRRLLAAKCADCHSAHSRTPFYGHFAPVSWLLERDIVEARRHMNISEWDTYTPDQQQTLIAKIVQQAKSRTMPPAQYTLIHRDARVTAADIQTLTAWAHADTASNDGAQPTTPGDPTRGDALFEKRCSGCHALTQNHEGPRLQGVYGRPAAAIPNFPYSAALRNAPLTWNDRTLNQWLTDPDAFLPGNNMDFHLARPQERADLIAWLQQSATR